jgi:Immunity protein Imm1
MGPTASSGYTAAFRIKVGVMATTLEWNNHEVPVGSVAELDALLDRLTDEASEQPFIVTLGRDDDSSLSIGLGRSETVASYISPGLGPPHFLSRGNGGHDGPVEFMFSGEVTEYPPESAIPVGAARKALRVYFETGELTPDVDWEEI